MKFIKNAKAVVRITEFISNTQTTKTFNLTFKDEEEEVLTFQIPPNVKEINVELTSQIMKVTSSSLTSLQSISKRFRVHEHSGSNQMQELYLRKEGREYFLYLLGRNGEANRKKRI